MQSFRLDRCRWYLRKRLVNDILAVTIVHSTLPQSSIVINSRFWKIYLHLSVKRHSSLNVILWGKFAKFQCPVNVPETVVIMPCEPFECLGSETHRKRSEIYLWYSPDFPFANLYDNPREMRVWSLQCWIAETHSKRTGPFPGKISSCVSGTLLPGSTKVVGSISSVGSYLKSPEYCFRSWPSFWINTNLSNSTFRSFLRRFRNLKMQNNISWCCSKTHLSNPCLIPWTTT